MNAPEDIPPILKDKRYADKSAFTPESLLRESRRQKRLPDAQAPRICVLDPDGDLVTQLQRDNRCVPDPNWACYHTTLFRFVEAGIEFGIVACAVGAPFAVLVAEELFACGCSILISVTSAGQLDTRQTPPYFVLIEQALRDEGTSYHYLPPAEFSRVSPELMDLVTDAFTDLQVSVFRGSVWTTDAPFRETENAIEKMRARGLLAVEMEAAALYAFAQARDRRVLCFAHVTNQMGRIEGDFEKGDADGTIDALSVIVRAARKLLTVL
jgi:uridine phosphorylase